MRSSSSGWDSCCAGSRKYACAWRATVCSPRSASAHCPFCHVIVGLVCGSDAAAKRDVVETAQKRYRGRAVPDCRGGGSGRRGGGADCGCAANVDADPEVDVIVLARGGAGSKIRCRFRRGLCRVVAECPTPVVPRSATSRTHPSSTWSPTSAPAHRAWPPACRARPQRGMRPTSIAAGRPGQARARGRAVTARRLLQLLVTRPAFADPGSWITPADAARPRPATRRRPPSLRVAREPRGSNVRHRLRVLGPAGLSSARRSRPGRYRSRWSARRGGRGRPARRGAGSRPGSARSPGPGVQP